MAGKAVYKKFTRKFGNDAAKAILYGDSRSFVMKTDLPGDNKDKYVDLYVGTNGIGYMGNKRDYKDAYAGMIAKDKIVYKPKEKFMQEFEKFQTGVRNLYSKGTLKPEGVEQRFSNFKKNLDAIKFK